jgi:hypothetical protein
MDLREVGCEGVNFIQNSAQSWAALNTLINLRVP